MRTLLTPHFCLLEFTRSGVATQEGIPNNPSQQQTENLRLLCQNVLEPLRQRFGPIVISSGFRSVALNRAVGGVPSSQHTKGEAADIVIGSPQRGVEMFRFIQRYLDFDQLVWEPIGASEPRWLHVSWTKRHRNRHSVL